MEDLQAVLQSALQSLMVRFSTDSSFREGCLFGLVVAGFVGAFSNWLLGRANRINTFFSATPRSFTPGPSPFARMNGCIEAVIMLVVVLGLMLLVLHLAFPG